MDLRPSVIRGFEDYDLIVEKDHKCFVNYKRIERLPLEYIGVVFRSAARIRMNHVCGVSTRSAFI